MNEILLYGDIGSAWWSDDGITDINVHNELKNLDPTCASHKIRINSMGGMCDQGITIMNLIRSHKAQMKASNPDFKLITVNEGYAMSIASVIFMAGDERIMALGSLAMIHDAWTYAAGNATELRATADNLESLSSNIADVYASLCTPADKDGEARNNTYFRALMKSESYFTGSEAVACGLATHTDTAIQASVRPDLSPERMKGKYVSVMLASYKNRAPVKPTATKSLVDAKVAMQRLKQMEASIIS